MKFFEKFGKKNVIAENSGDDWHRLGVGGMWEEIGKLQYELVVREGLLPRHKLLDVGCGSLRGGVHFIRYLDSGNYYGMDKNEKLLSAGHDVELPRMSPRLAWSPSYVARALIQRNGAGLTGPRAPDQLAARG